MRARSILWTCSLTLAALAASGCRTTSEGQFPFAPGQGQAQGPAQQYITQTGWVPPESPTGSAYAAQQPRKTVNPSQFTPASPVQRFVQAKPVRQLSPLEPITIQNQSPARVQPPSTPPQGQRTVSLLRRPSQDSAPIAVEIPEPTTVHSKTRSLLKPMLKRQPVVPTPDPEKKSLLKKPVEQTGTRSLLPGKAAALVPPPPSIPVEAPKTKPTPVRHMSRIPPPPPPVPLTPAPEQTVPSPKKKPSRPLLDEIPPPPPIPGIGQ